MQDDLKNMTQ